MFHKLKLSQESFDRQGLAFRVRQTIFFRPVRYRWKSKRVGIDRRLAIVFFLFSPH
jgi:hypothetical protein